MNVASTPAYIGVTRPFEQFPSVQFAPDGTRLISPGNAAVVKYDGNIHRVNANVVNAPVSGELRTAVQAALDEGLDQMHAYTDPKDVQRLNANVVRYLGLAEGTEVFGVSGGASDLPHRILAGRNPYNKFSYNLAAIDRSTLSGKAKYLYHFIANPIKETFLRFNPFYKYKMTAAIPSLGFGMNESNGVVSGATFKHIRHQVFQSGKELTFELDVQHAKQLFKQGVKAMFIDTPINPGGALPSLDNLREIMIAARKHGAEVIIDTAYANYTPKEYMQGLAKLFTEFEGTMSYQFSMAKMGAAGLRTAFYIPSSRALAQHFASKMPAVGLGVFQTKVANAIFEKGQAYLADVRQQVSESMQLYDDLVRKTGLFFSKGTNYMLIHGHDKFNGTKLYELFAKFGVLTRPMDQYGPDAVRISGADRGAFEQIKLAFKELVAIASKAGFAKDGIETSGVRHIIEGFSGNRALKSVALLVTGGVAAAAALQSAWRSSSRPQYV